MLIFHTYEQPGKKVHTYKQKSTILMMAQSRVLNYQYFLRNFNVFWCHIFINKNLHLSFNYHQICHKRLSQEQPGAAQGSPGAAQEWPELLNFCHTYTEILTFLKLNKTRISFLSHVYRNINSFEHQLAGKCGNVHTYNEKPLLLNVAAVAAAMAVTLVRQKSAHV